ncbi:MAG: CobW family GTP-binding protein [Solirubrobacteraceae bacterium]
MATVPEIQLTVIGGYLGAGKTTLLNHMLNGAGDRRLAVLVNDFGAINIDAELIESRDGDMVNLSNGCICCGIGTDFIAALASFRDGEGPPEHVVVEASGVADPTQIAVLGEMPGYARDAVVVVVDAETARTRGEDEATAGLLVAQLRSADLLVLNKTDLVEPDALESLRVWLRETVGRSTAIVDATFGAVPADVLIGARAGAPRSAARSRGHELADDGHEPADYDHSGHDQLGHDPSDRDHAGHDHAGHAHYDSWSWSGDAPVSGTGLVEALEALPDGVVRAKGFLHLREDAERRYLLQLVGRRYSIEARGSWGEDPPCSRLVIIGIPGSFDASELDRTMARLSAATASAAG